MGWAHFKVTHTYWTPVSNPMGCILIFCHFTNNESEALGNSPRSPAQLWVAPEHTRMPRAPRQWAKAWPCPKTAPATAWPASRAEPERSLPLHSAVCKALPPVFGGKLACALGPARLPFRGWLPYPLFLLAYLQLPVSTVSIKHTQISLTFGGKTRSTPVRDSPAGVSPAASLSLSSPAWL